MKLLPNHFHVLGCPPALHDTGPFACQATSRFLIHPGKFSKKSRSENKASLIQVEEKKETRLQAAVKEAKSTGPSGPWPAHE